MVVAAWTLWEISSIKQWWASGCAVAWGSLVFAAPVCAMTSVSFGQIISKIFLVSDSQ
jgi:hypothetical protein